MNQNYQKQHGFSLIEVMVVVAIIAILAGIALPSYREYVRKGNRSDGQAALLNLGSALEKYFYTNKTYTATLSDVGYSSATSSEGHYTLSIVAATTACPIASCYEIKATAIGGQVADGDLTMNSFGQKLPADKW